MGRKISEIIQALPKSRRDAIERNADRLAHEMIEYSLKELRESTNKTQAEVALALKVPQNAVSQLESRQDMRLSTVERYVAALGGTLSLLVELGEGRRCLLRHEGDDRGAFAGDNRTTNATGRAPPARRRLKAAKK